MSRLVVCLMLWAAIAQARPFGPFRTEAAPVTRDARAELLPLVWLPTDDPLWFAFQVYEATLSSQDGPRCMHEPTCAMYGVQAVRRHRFLGFFLTVDRLWRAGRSSYLRPLPRDFQGGKAHFYDPVAASDFWLRGIPDLKMPELLPPRPRQ